VDTDGHTRLRSLQKKTVKKSCKMGGNEKGGGPGLPASLFPHAGKPADLTEGGQPVVCWLPIKPLKHANGFVQDVKKTRILMKSLWD
jgi:hypothetical protein